MKKYVFENTTNRKNFNFPHLQYRLLEITCTAPISKYGFGPPYV